MVSLFARATRNVGATHIRYLTPVSLGTATGPVAGIYRAVERDFGMLAPPLTLHAAAPATLAAAWLMLRETLLVPGLLGRAAKEAMAAAVSSTNRCPYCVDVHGTTVVGLLGAPDAAAVAAGELADPWLRALTRWAGSGPGSLARPDGPPVSPAEAPEAIGLVVTFHYINRMVNIFLSESPLPPLPAPALRPVRRAAARILGRLARRVPQPAGRFDLLPAAPLPADLSWAAGRPAIADAFARAGAAFDAAGARSVPEPVRRLVADRLAAGDRPGLDHRTWLAEAVAALAEPDRPAARLALLAAVGSYLATDALVTDFLARGHGEDALVEVAGWASMAAARSIGDRLWRDLDGIVVDS
ncbi:carboxymuconolactone decarboxylase family protein [Rhizomonospora bruguierae]|uniref:carboxymuconolactone decarboxylase family protein n=1 Tax=Rhizomonospora bruguierae TaxID=1581705 RepID=UPI001BCFD1FF|nr:carboxymuconolactone decarboxylase family protein [Micromonospora sp. NBRC 107566]